MASKPEKAPEEPQEQIIATLHLPLDVTDFVAITSGITERFPSAVIRHNPQDNERPQIVVPVDTATGLPGDERAERSSRAQELLRSIVSEERLPGMIDNAEDNGVLTTDEAADLRRVCSEAETFLGFGAS